MKDHTPHNRAGDMANWGNQAPIRPESMPLATGKTVAEKTIQNAATFQGQISVSDLDPKNGAGAKGGLVPAGGRDMITGYSPDGTDVQVSSQGGKRNSGSMTKKKVIKGNPAELENF